MNILPSFYRKIYLFVFKTSHESTALFICQTFDPRGYFIFTGQVVRKQACRHTQAANVDRQMFAKGENKKKQVGAK